MYTIVRLRNLLIALAAALAGILAVGAPVYFTGTSAPVTGGGEIKLPVIMYHSLLKSRTSTYVLSPDDFEKDLQYLKDNGFQTVIAADLIAYVGGNGSLPEKPVMITFDDGFLNNITYAVPLLEQYGMRAVIAVVGKYTEDSEASGDRNPSYAYLNWEDIRQLIASDTVEIQNHSYDLHKKGPRIGADRKKGEAMEDYERILGEDITTYRRLMDEKTGYTAAAFAYPLGEYSKSSEEVLKKQGFSATMTCREKINTITRDPDCLFGLGRFNRPGGVSTGKFFERVLKGY